MEPAVEQVAAHAQLLRQFTNRPAGGEQRKRLVLELTGVNASGPRLIIVLYGWSCWSNHRAPQATVLRELGRGGVSAAEFYRRRVCLTRR